MSQAPTLSEQYRARVREYADEWLKDPQIQMFIAQSNRNAVYNWIWTSNGQITWLTEDILKEMRIW